MKRLFAPGLVLFFLPALVAEMLSGNEPLAHWVAGPAVLVLTVLYGGGAILIREAVLRWGKGWPTLLVLGVAYAILEEGLMTKAFFDPDWEGLGPVPGYGRWAGVNVAWACGMLVYHSLVSIVIPIVLVGLAFPERRAESWVGRRTQIILCVLLLADVLLGFLAFGGRPPGTPEGVPTPPYRPPLIPYLAAVAAVVLLVLWAKRLPVVPRSVPLGTPRAARPVWFYLVGFGAMVSFFLVSFLIPNLVSNGRRPHAIFEILAQAALVAVGTRLVWRMTRGGCVWTDNRALALIAGALTPFIFFAGLGEFTGGFSGKNMRGMLLVAIGWTVFLFVLRRAVRRRGKISAECGVRNAK